jgi:GTP-binding protein
MTSGTGLLHHVFDRYAPVKSGPLAQRPKGVLISNGTGKALAYALFNLQERGKLFVGPGEPVYEGQIVGEHVRANDLTVNPLKAKQLSNVRAAGKDDNVLLTPATRLSLEQALEFIDDDELVEITPEAIRLRKEHLAEGRRRQEARKQA